MVDSSQLKASEFFRKPEYEGEVEVKCVSPGMDMDKAGESSPAMASLLPRMMSAVTKIRLVIEFLSFGVNCLDC